jgi:hypothetical protein
VFILLPPPVCPSAGEAAATARPEPIPLIIFLRDIAEPSFELIALLQSLCGVLCLLRQLLHLERIGCNRIVVSCATRRVAVDDVKEAQQERAGEENPRPLRVL